MLTRRKLKLPVTFQQAIPDIKAESWQEAIKQLTDAQRAHKKELYEIFKALVAYTEGLNSPNALQITQATITDSDLSDVTLPLDDITGLGTGVATFLATPSSANLASALTDEQGSSKALFGSIATWTPALKFGGNSTGLTYSAQTGNRIYVGDWAMANGRILLSNKGSSTGSATITGLDATSADFAVVAAYMTGVSFANQFMAVIASGSATILLQETTEAGVATDLDDTNFSNTSQVIFSVFYKR